MRSTAKSAKENRPENRHQNRRENRDGDRVCRRDGDRRYRAPAAAFNINGPGFHVWIGHHHPHYYDYYRGPVGGGGWNTWNGCPPNYTIPGRRL